MSVTDDEPLRSDLRGLRTTGQIQACATFCDRPCSAIHERTTRSAVRSPARRIRLLDTEVDEHNRALEQLLDQAAAQLVAEGGIGDVTAASFGIASSHPGRGSLARTEREAIRCGKRFLARRVWRLPEHPPISP